MNSPQPSSLFPAAPVLSLLFVFSQEPESIWDALTGGIPPGIIHALAAPASLNSVFEASHDQVCWSLSARCGAPPPPPHPDLSTSVSSTAATGHSAFLEMTVVTPLLPQEDVHQPLVFSCSWNNNNRRIQVWQKRSGNTFILSTLWEENVHYEEFTWIWWR